MTYRPAKEGILYLQTTMYSVSPYLSKFSKSWMQHLLLSCTVPFHQSHREALVTTCSLPSRTWTRTGSSQWWAGPPPAARTAAVHLKCGIQECTKIKETVFIILYTRCQEIYQMCVKGRVGTGKGVTFALPLVHICTFLEEPIYLVTTSQLVEKENVKITK